MTQAESKKVEMAIVELTTAFAEIGYHVEHIEIIKRVFKWKPPTCFNAPFGVIKVKEKETEE